MWGQVLCRDPHSGEQVWAAEADCRVSYLGGHGYALRHMGAFFFRMPLCLVTTPSC